MTSHYHLPLSDEYDNNEDANSSPADEPKRRADRVPNTLYKRKNGLIGLWKSYGWRCPHNKLYSKCSICTQTQTPVVQNNNNVVGDNTTVPIVQQKNNTSVVIDDEHIVQQNNNTTLVHNNDEPIVQQNNNTTIVHNNNTSLDNISPIPEPACKKNRIPNTLYKRKNGKVCVWKNSYWACRHGKQTSSCKVCNNKKKKKKSNSKNTIHNSTITNNVTLLQEEELGVNANTNAFTNGTIEIKNVLNKTDTDDEDDDDDDTPDTFDVKSKYYHSHDVMMADDVKVDITFHFKDGSTGNYNQVSCNVMESIEDIVHKAFTMTNTIITFDDIVDVIVNGTSKFNHLDEIVQDSMDIEIIQCGAK